MAFWSSTPLIIPHSNVYLTQKQIAFMPYAGNGTPTLKRFKLVFDCNEDGSNDEGYYLLISFLIDPSGNASGVIWTVVYESNFDPQTAYVATPQVETSPSKNGDGTYKLEPKTYGEKDTGSGGLIIDSFKLESHSGTGTLRSTTVSYSATEL